jgi:hypothetical protein
MRQIEVSPDIVRPFTRWRRLDDQRRARGTHQVALVRGALFE